MLGKDPLFILDGGHNPQCAEALIESIREYVADPDKGEKVTFLIGILADKDYDTTLRLLAPFGAEYICITPDSPRALNASGLADEINKMCTENGTKDKVKVCVRENIDDAIMTADTSPYPTIAFGSLYSAGEIRRRYRILHK